MTALLAAIAAGLVAILATIAVERMGGSVVTESDGYLHATFQTRFFRFVDDVELRLEESEKVIHIRSASRVGGSDFGANRKRVEKLRSLYTEGR